MKLTERYQVLPDMPPEQYEALKADIAERGVLTPIDVDEDGNILDGHHRYRACVEMGITDFPTIVRTGLTEEERRVFARKSNMLRRHLTRAQKRQLIAEQLKDTPEWADNRIAQELGVTGKTVAQVREKLEATSEIPKLDRLVGTDGKQRPRKLKRRAAVMSANIEELEKVLACLCNGATPESVRAELEGFMSAASAITFVSPHYDPFHGCTDEEKREWVLFIRFLMERAGWSPDGAGAHFEWLRGREFRTPGEWLGEEGTRFRNCITMREPSKRVKKAWAMFLDDHACTSLEELDRWARVAA